MSPRREAAWTWGLTMDATLIQLPTPLVPTPEQEARLTRLALQTQQARAALCTWVWARTVGGDPDLTQHLHRVMQADLTMLRPPEGRGVAPRISLAEVGVTLRRALDETQVSLPAATVTALASRFARELQGLIGQPVYASQLPQPDPDVRVPLDADLLAADPHHLHVTGWPDLMLADLWRLPMGLGHALTGSGAVSLRRLGAEARRLQGRDRDGDPTALAALRDLARQHSAVWGQAASGSVGAVPRTQPHRSGHATLHRRAAPDGSGQWVVTWSIRVPGGWLPPVTRAGVVGVDPGVRAPLTWADGERHGQLRAPRLHVTDPGEAGAEHPSALLLDAVTRRAHYERLAPDLDATLRLLLSYGVIAVEDTRWSHLADDGVTWPREVMTRTGMTEVLGWLRMLGGVSGSRVVGVSAWQASHRCGQCGAPGHRDVRANLFNCGRCGWCADADINAALYHRWWVLHEADSPAVRHPTRRSGSPVRVG